MISARLLPLLLFGCGSPKPEGAAQHTGHTAESGTPDDGSAGASDGGDGDGSDGDGDDVGGDGTGDSGTDTGDEPTVDPFPLSLTPTFDRERTVDNPLRGFYTNYAWGEPTTPFPDSLEFAYIPLADLMDGPGSFTFASGLEPHLVEAEARGHQLILRPYLDYPGSPTGLPAFLAAEVPTEPYADYGGGLSPDYADPELRAALLAFVEALGAEYDGDPRIAVVQAGLLGFWGEWHTYPYTDWFADEDFQSELLHAYSDAFAQTLLQVRYPAVDSPDLRFGFHDDSFAYSTVGETAWFFVPQLEAAGAENRWREVPIGGEVRPELQSIMFEDGYDTDDPYRQPFDECVAATHASMLLNYAAFAGGFETAEEELRAHAAALSLGYALHLATLSIREGVLTAEIENRGSAPFYYPHRLAVTDATGRTTTTPLSPITAEDGLVAVSLDISTLSPPEPGAPWTLSLGSDHILPAQQIRFASTLTHDLIVIE